MGKASAEETETVQVTISVGSITVEISTLATGCSTTGAVVIILLATLQRFLTRLTGSVSVLLAPPAP